MKRIIRELKYAITLAQVNDKPDKDLLENLKTELKNILIEIDSKLRGVI